MTLLPWIWSSLCPTGQRWLSLNSVRTTVEEIQDKLLWLHCSSGAPVPVQHHLRRVYDGHTHLAAHRPVWLTGQGVQTHKHTSRSVLMSTFPFGILLICIHACTLVLLLSRSCYSFRRVSELCRLCQPWSWWQPWWTWLWTWASTWTTHRDSMRRRGTRSLQKGPTIGWSFCYRNGKR